jgi:hypothetical protein
MRKLSLIAAASLLVPVAAQAKPINELLLDKGVLGAADMKKDAGPARLTYDNGATLEFPSAGAKWKMNVRLQSVYTFNDVKRGDDIHSFDARNVRLDLGGSILNDEFSFKVTNDFTKDSDTGTEGSKLQDAYIDWHACPECNIRAGQWMTPYGRQWMTENHNLQFIDRSIAGQTFNFGRQEGVAYYGSLGDSFRHQVALFNGTNIGEGQNTGGTDNKFLAMYNASFDVMGSYDRGFEGDVGMSDGSAGFGFSAYYGQGDFGLNTGEGFVGSETDRYGAAVDFGYRGGGFSFQAEGFYEGWKFDDGFLAGDEDTAANWGFYVQTGLMLSEQLEAAGRFSWVTMDENVAGVRSLRTAGGRVLDGFAENYYEVNAVLNYYLNGHNLKIQTGPSWLFGDDEVAGSRDIKDFRYQVGLMGYF